MVFSADRSLPKGAVELRSVRRSLNMPITAIAELPVGPASAAIAVHGDSDGGAAHWTLAVRCERTREIVYFTAREPIGEPLMLADAALSLADGMGFLFDDQVLDTSRPADGDARGLWDEFVEANRVPSPLAASALGAEAVAPKGVGLTKFRYALKRAEPKSSPVSVSSDGSSSASRSARRPAGKKWTWKEFLWRSTE